ncbi:MAG TPA: DNA alkylation repair protein [Clostridia bacterium]|nr:DNA alkylation repair protein [Clostridia bacterium]
MTAAGSLAGRPPGETTLRSTAFVDAHRDEAVALGQRLAELIQDPDAYRTELGDGLARLGDPEVVEGQHFVAPGLGPTLGVRNPLLVAVARSFDRATRRDRPSALLFVVERLFGAPYLELHWFAFGLLRRTLRVEPERTWQLLRRAARTAGDWITVDTLARPYAAGIVAEPYRWAELEQLVYSPSRWERRLVGSTIATIPFVSRREGRTPEIAHRGLAILGTLIGDAEPDVQKALSWAYRTMAAIDRDATTAALTAEAERAAATDDGQRAWVIRDSVAKLEPAVAARLRARLEGIRRRPGAASTSSAAELAARFGGLPDPSIHPEPPLR